MKACILHEAHDHEHTARHGTHAHAETQCNIGPRRSPDGGAAPAASFACGLVRAPLHLRSRTDFTRTPFLVVVPWAVGSVFTLLLAGCFRSPTSPCCSHLLSTCSPPDSRKPRPRRHPSSHPPIPWPHPAAKPGRLRDSLTSHVLCRGAQERLATDPWLAKPVASEASGQRSQRNGLP